MILHKYKNYASEFRAANRCPALGGGDDQHILVTFLMTFFFARQTFFHHFLLKFNYWGGGGWRSNIGGGGCIPARDLQPCLNSILNHTRFISRVGVYCL